ncbi:MAG: hypothetical protein EXS14_07630 [Planctomycetes bacterium]|nr:hypothetical protein [Planctomycetota bacterium]
MAQLRHGDITALPVVHGRLACALEARRLLQSASWTDLVVELPPSLQSTMESGLELLPRISALVYRHDADFDGHNAARWYVPVDPCDAMVEALRLATNMNLSVHYADREVRDFVPKPTILPDAAALQTLGAEAWWHSLQPLLAKHPRDEQDAQREQHMAAVLQRVQRERGASARILFLCGLAHWGPIRTLLQSANVLCEDPGEVPERVELHTLARFSLPQAMAELPWMAARWERHRRRTPTANFELAAQIPHLLLAARDAFERKHGDTLERPTPARLATLVDFARKLTVRSGRLLPDAWTLGVAARGCVGNDYALALLETAEQYTANPADGLRLHKDHAVVEGTSVRMWPRTPGEAREMKPLRLRREPPPELRQRWRRAWDPTRACSWLPEDATIEAFRRHVCGNALALAGLDRRRTEPFSASLLDGLDLRATLRDPLLRLHVREDPRVPGGVGAFVLIFEDDPQGDRFPYRSTWYAEKPWESTLAFYATNPLATPVGPGVALSHYGGAMFLYPPLPIPDIWDDLRFEQSRTSAERLLRAAVYWSQDKFVVHVSEQPPSRRIEAEAARLGKHIVHLPLTAFPTTQLQRLRRMHILNGNTVRSWAGRWIR